MAVDFVSGAMLRPNSRPLCVPDVLLPHGAGELGGTLIDQRRGLGLPLPLANRPGRDFVGGSRPRLACVLILANDPLELVLIRWPRRNAVTPRDGYPLLHEITLLPRNDRHSSPPIRQG